MMERLSLWTMFKRWWWLVAIPAAVSLLLTLPTLKNVVAPPVTYGVTLRLTAAAPPEAEIEGVTTPYEDTVYVPLLASEYVVVNMPHWITSDSFAAEVSRLLALDGTTIAADDLRPAFNADSFRSILILYVNWDNEAELRAIASAAVTALQTRNQSYFPQFAAVPVQVVALDEVKVNQVAPPITMRLNPLIRIMLGVMAGLALMVLAEYLDDSIRSRTDVEALGLPVVGEIPRE
jgi:capsular polysaccharide biosynthesis protein